MMRSNARTPWFALPLAFVVGCGEVDRSDSREPGSEMASGAVEQACDMSGARATVEDFGEVLARVSLLAPDSLIAQQVRDEYAPFVTPELLERWTVDPAAAPGRDVSSPWPDRIEVTSVKEAGARTCQVDGQVVYVTSMGMAQGGTAAHVPVSLRVVESDGWKIDSYQAAAPFEPGELPDVGAAADVIRRYYMAINGRDYARAYALWGENGAASEQEFEDFVEGFAETVSVAVEVGDPERVDPAAGSRYVSVPVVIRATTTDGREQRFEGTYTLRQSVVDGASEAQRAWHIYSSDMTEIQSR